MFVYRYLIKKQKNCHVFAPGTSTTSSSTISICTSTYTSTAKRRCRSLSSSDSDVEPDVNVHNKRKLYSQKYCTKWEVEFKWCRKSQDLDSPYCIICNKELRGNKTHLTSYSLSAAHKKNSEIKTLQKLKIVFIEQFLKIII